MDRAAGEPPWCLAGVVVGNRFGAVFPDVEPLAGDGELAGLGLDAALPGLLVGTVLIGFGNASNQLSRYTAADMYPEHRRASAIGSLSARNMF